MLEGLVRMILPTEGERLMSLRTVESQLMRLGWTAPPNYAESPGPSLSHQQLVALAESQLEHDTSTATRFRRVYPAISQPTSCVQSALRTSTEYRRLVPPSSNDRILSAFEEQTFGQA